VLDCQGATSTASTVHPKVAGECQCPCNFIYRLRLVGDPTEDPRYSPCIKASDKHVKVLHLHNTAPGKQIEVHVETQPRHLRARTRSMGQQTHGEGPRFSGELPCSQCGGTIVEYLWWNRPLPQRLSFQVYHVLCLHKVGTPCRCVHALTMGENRPSEHFPPNQSNFDTMHRYLYQQPNVHVL